MSKGIDLEGGRRGDAHLKRAKELGKTPRSPRARVVPMAESIATSGNIILTVEELAGVVRLHPITIRRDIRAGKLRAASGGGKSAYRISRADAEAWWRRRGGGPLFGGAAANGATRRGGDNGTEYSGATDDTQMEDKAEYSASPADFLRLTQELMPIIKAGSLTTPGSVAPTTTLDAVREGREAELTAASRVSE